MNALSKALVTDEVCTQLGMSRTQAREMVELFFEEIRHALETGNHVRLSRFGNFILRDKAERPGRNPKTGEEIPVQARRVVTFKTGLKLKHKVESRK